MGVAAANLAAAESDPFLPQSYELTPHWSLIKGTCMVSFFFLGVCCWMLAFKVCLGGGRKRVWLYVDDRKAVRL